MYWILTYNGWYLFYIDKLNAIALTNFDCVSAVIRLYIVLAAVDIMDSSLNDEEIVHQYNLPMQLICRYADNNFDFASEID